MDMELKFKPDFEESKEAWRHFWAKEKWRRPLVHAVVPKTKKESDPILGLRYYHAVTGLTGKWLDAFDAHFDNHVYAAEALPYLAPDFGPDQFAAILGAPLKFDEASKGTNWVEPIVEDWAEFLPKIKVSADDKTWSGMLDLARMIARKAKGKYLVGVCDLHSNADTLSALRTPERLCMDFYDFPELVEEAMLAVRKMYRPVYETLYEASGMSRETGSCGWAPFWSEGRFATIQCDFICMVSPEISRKYIIPALEEEAVFLDNCVLHFDGPGALPHLDDVLAIKDIDVIQWVPGAGQPKMWEPAWRDVLRRCQKAGKGLQIYDITIEQAKTLHRELEPNGLLYCVSASTLKEVEDFCGWLEKNS
jgi:hypothetical protein